MPHPLLIFSQSDYLSQIVAINSHTLYFMTNCAYPDQLASKPTDLDKHCLLRQGISGYPVLSGQGLNTTVAPDMAPLSREKN